MVVNKRSLKKSKSGSEAEFFLLNRRGYMVKEADKFIKTAKKKYPKLQIVPEAGASMVETGSFPSVNVLDTMIDLLENIKQMIDVADHHSYVLYPFGTYPGKIKPEVTEQRWYQEQLKIFGREKNINATLCCGFHYHYTLPRGVFDFKTKFLKSMVNSKIKQSMIDSYNLAIAFDPAITTLMQSSPFAQGKYLAKDSRMLMYRGGKKLGYVTGKYSNHGMLGQLPPYKQTLNDLMFSLRKRQEKWKSMMLKEKLDPSWIIKKSNILAFTWNPVKINQLGTLEIRSPDMNLPSNIMALASLLKFTFRQVYRDFYKVMPSDIGLEEPFKVEGNIIHIPPHTHVRNDLQKESAYKGLANKDIENYTRRFFRFAKQFTEKNYYPVIKPLQDMIEEKQTVSDKIIKQFKKKGYTIKDNIPNDVCAEIALKNCDKLLEDVMHTEERIYNAYNMCMPR